VKRGVPAQASSVGLRFWRSLYRSWSARDEVFEVIVLLKLREPDGDGCLLGRGQLGVHACEALGRLCHGDVDHAAEKLVAAEADD
jgi:hypothetical protein